MDRVICPRCDTFTPSPTGTVHLCPPCHAEVTFRLTVWHTRAKRRVAFGLPPALLTLEDLP